MRPARRLSALTIALCLVPCLAAPLLAQAASTRTATPVAMTLAMGGQPAAAPSAPPEASPAAPPAAAAPVVQEELAALPIHMDKDLAREHDRFSRFAQEQVARMNANILGGRHHMQVSRGHDGLFYASYKAIDVPGLVCQVRRSESNPQFYVGNLIYKEVVLESVGRTAEACRQGQFTPVSEKSHRLIYTSKKGGGWQ